MNNLLFLLVFLLVFIFLGPFITEEEGGLTLYDGLFTGVVNRIAPASESEGGVVNYPVTIRLDDSNLTGVRPGMTAVATTTDDETAAGWLVPSNAVVEFEGETSVLVARNRRQVRVEVTPGRSQGAS